VSSTADNREALTPGLVYGTGVAERLRSCTFAGPLPQPDASGEAGSVECGSLVRVELRIRAGIIEEARYQAHGCPATLASASQVCAAVTGGSFLAAASVAQSDICRALGLVHEKEYTAGIALDALHEALTAALSSAACDVGGAAVGPLSGAGTDPGGAASAGASTEGPGVLVGMSGGVDSAVAALLLKKQGYRVVGVTLTFWNDPGVADARSCCSPENVLRARRVAHSLGIPHVSLDARGAFYNDVVEYFISEYAAGRTPNPCAKCNSRVRLGLLVDVAHRLGLARVATGHYARLIGRPPRIARGADETKDQSYVLAEVAPEILEHLVFPLGEMRKPEVRGLAAQAGLEGHSAPESQEICFVPDDDHRRFLRDRLGALPGEIVDAAGRVLGRHDGTYNYTIGQRKGLGIAAAEPLYVVALDAPERRVVVGPAAEGGIGAVRAAGLVWHRELGSGPFAVQVRSAGAALPVTGLVVDHDTFAVSLAGPVLGVAAGQTAVVYEGERVVVAGTIASTEKWDREPGCA
jgi:tRNA-uridine 2-sulfurtransferase